MRTRRSAPVLSAVLLASLLVPTSTSATVAEPDAPELLVATSSRLVPNDGFEESATSPLRWSVDAAGGSVAVVDQPVHAGSRALQVVDSSSTVGTSVRSQHLAAQPGETLTASAFAQRAAAGAQPGALYLEFWDADGARLNTTGADGTIHRGVVSKPVADVAGWQQISVTGTAPVHAVSATVLIYSSQSGTGTTVWDQVAVSSLPARETVQIPDPGFEENRGNPITEHWTLGSGSSIVTAGQRTGRQALRIADASTASGVSVYSRRVPVTAGWSVSATIWANADSGGAGSIYLEFRDAGGATQSNDTWRPHSALPDVTGWQQLAVSGVAPAGAKTVDILLNSSFAETGTTVWDDASVRTGADPGYTPAIGTGSVLFVGDERVESMSGIQRVVQPGTPSGDPALAGVGPGVVMESNSVTANPRPAATVLPTESGYEMWMTTGTGTVHATSADGRTWPAAQRTPTMLTTSAGAGYDQKTGPAAVVRNPRFGEAGQPKYYGLGAIRGPVSKRANYPTAGLPERRGMDYYAFASNDGVNWTLLDEEHPAIPGQDTVSVSYDQTIGKFVASSKDWTFTKEGGVSVYARAARTVQLSTSTDFHTWTQPTPVLAADLRDYDATAATNPGGSNALADARGRPVKSSDLYQAPMFRYGEQYLAIPSVDETTYAGTDLWPDVARAHLELTSSITGRQWSRPIRTKLVTPGAAGSWNWGFQLAGTQMLTVGNEVWLYYGSFQGRHGCPDTQAWLKGCNGETIGAANTGRVVWAKDRFVALRADSGGGTIVTRPITPAASGGTLHVNAVTGSGTLTVEVLGADGAPVPGYTATETTHLHGDLADQAVSWGTKTTLPAGQVRLRFSLTSGDFYAYSVR